MKLGLIVRNNKKGLGTQTLEYYRHLEPDKVLELRHSEDTPVTNRFDADIQAPFTTSEGIDISNDKLLDFLSEIDVLLSAETFYDDRMPELAKKVDTKLALQFNYEFFGDEDRYDADLYLAPSVWNWNRISQPKEYLPMPVDTEKIDFHEKKKAEVFFHNAGTRPAYDRDGTDLLLDAIPNVESDVKFIIKTQAGVGKIRDSRVEWDSKNYDDYTDCLQGDVLIYPRRYGGLSLKLNEALAYGMVPIMLDSPPVNRFLDKKYLVPTSTRHRIKIKNYVWWYDASANELAAKIDKFANKNIKFDSLASKDLIEHWSWENMKSKYISVLENLCQNKKRTT